MQVVDADSGQQVIPCKEFVEAANAIIAIFDSLSGMGPVQKDMVGNAKHIERHLEAMPGRSVQAMCEAELEAAGGDFKKVNKDGTMCCSLLWLKRALRMIEGCARAALPRATIPAARVLAR